MDDSENKNASIDRQSNLSKYGRGILHLSADLNEGDVIAYQDGTWYVDGTKVGDGSSPTVRYLIVDTIQVVWTHDCEHGVIRGFELMVTNHGSGGVETGVLVERGSCFVSTTEYIQLGPEQLLARIPTIPMQQRLRGVDEEVKVSLVKFDPDSEVMRA